MLGARSEARALTKRIPEALLQSATPLAAKSSSSVRKGHIVAGLREFVSLRRELQIFAASGVADSTRPSLPGTPRATMARRFTAANSEI
jgi:hypothetical protein